MKLLSQSINISACKCLIMLFSTFIILYYSYSYNLTFCYKIMYNL